MSTFGSRHYKNVDIGSRHQMKSIPTNRKVFEHVEVWFMWVFRIWLRNMIIPYMIVVYDLQHTTTRICWLYITIPYMTSRIWLSYVSIPYIITSDIWLFRIWFLYMPVGICLSVYGYRIWLYRIRLTVYDYLIWLFFIWLRHMIRSYMISVYDSRYMITRIGFAYTNI